MSISHAGNNNSSVYSVFVLIVSKIHCTNAYRLATANIPAKLVDFWLVVYSFHYRCDKVRIWIRQRSNFERFQQNQNSTKVLSTLLSNANLWKNPCSTTDFICTERATERRQTFFFKFNLSHKLQLLNVQHNFCSVMYYTVLIRTMILLTLGNNILLQSLNWQRFTFQLIK